MKINNKDKQNTFEVVLPAGEIDLSCETGSLFIQGIHFILVDSSLYFPCFLESGYARLCIPYQTESTSILILTKGIIPSS